MSFDDFAIVNVGRNDYRIPFWFMLEVEAVSRMKNSGQSEKNAQLKKNKTIRLL